jgi:hypothetical protein
MTIEEFISSLNIEQSQSLYDFLTDESITDNELLAGVVVDLTDMLEIHLEFNYPSDSPSQPSLD